MKHGVITIHIWLHSEFMERQLWNSYFDNSCATDCGEKHFSSMTGLALVSGSQCAEGTVDDTKGNKR
jgi:hypothetical protein